MIGRGVVKIAPTAAAVWAKRTLLYRIVVVFYVASGCDSHLNPNETEWVNNRFRCDSYGGCSAKTHVRGLGRRYAKCPCSSLNSFLLHWDAKSALPLLRSSLRSLLCE